jgi:release factor glutamine methyltransferase
MKILKTVCPDVFIMKIQQAYQDSIHRLAKAYDAREAQSLSRIVFEDVFGITNPAREGELDTEATAQLEDILIQLLAGRPLQYILGQADFYGLKFRLNEHTLIPRQETEELVYWILEQHTPAAALKVLDIGTGTGCIPIALKKHRPNWRASALDVSAEAIAVAQDNARSLGVDVHFQEQDVLSLDALEGQWDIIVSNPPYIPVQESALMSKQVLDHEPHLALFVADDDPLVFYRKIARLAKEALSPDGRLYFELNEFNAEAVAALLKEAGFAEVEIGVDINGKQRMLVGQISSRE